MNAEDIIEALNRALAAELSAIEIYTAHARVIREPGVAQGVLAIRDVEQEHARALAGRVRSLGGVPVPPGAPATVVGRAAGAVTTQLSTADMLLLELSEEQQAMIDYVASIAQIMDDYDTLDLLEEHLVDEMRHARWLKSQIRAAQARPVAT
jgi:bacterioferritin (cytochrome b1)